MMYNDHFEHRLLLILLLHMSDEQHDEIRKKIASHAGMSKAFEELLEESLCTPFSAEENADSDWRLCDSSTNILFVNLLNHYVDRKMETHHKAKGTKITLVDIYTAVNNHSKWYRMVKHGGRGDYYHDDVRRVCFVLELTFLEATELLYSAGQPLERTSMRDKILAACLCDRIYDEHAVNQKLLDAKQKPLFIM